ncbi:hypothetical protein AB0F72_38645 [Actinoplanes sp. NPDC023936]|uniref:5'-methylthioadenosine/S-adenosylhomocysteine nucleosidase family protein n=1 Tax=Actinoplanes sp. NPDC023936 TaxID=3154910 RepID=UPI0033F98BBA
MLLFLAAREGRLIGSADAFAVIEPPIARMSEWNAAMRVLPRDVRAIAWLARAWQFILPVAPVLIAMLVAVPLVLLHRANALTALVLILAGLTVLAGDMTVSVIRLAGELIRSGSANTTDNEIIGNELRGHCWTIAFGHALEPADVDRLSAEAFRRVSALTDAMLPEDPAFGSECLGVRVQSFAGRDARDALGSLPSLQRIPRTDWFVIGARTDFKRPDHEAVRPLSIVRLMLVATTLCVLVSAQVVASLERQACSTPGCDDRQLSYPWALRWIIEYVFFQFPESVTWQAQLLGLLVMVAVPVMVICVFMATRQRLRYRRARRDLMYDAIKRMAAQPAVAILVVNEAESKAVRDAFVARSPGLVPATGKVGGKAVTQLGVLGGARIVMAQSEQGTVGAGSMPWTVDNLVKNLDPVFLVLTGVCYGLDSRELDGGKQDIGDVVVATQLRAVEHRKVTTRADGSQYEITRGPRPETSSDLLSHARVLGHARQPAVHFGPVLSLNTLVNSAEERARLRALDEEAIAGEMEATGLYAAASQVKSDWIIVKGISDWGVEKADDFQAAAARNAADIVADLIVQIAPGAERGRAGSDVLES